MSFASSSSDFDRQSRRLNSTLAPPTRTERPVTADRPDNSNNNSLRVSLSHRSVTTSTSHARPPSNRSPMDPSSVVNRSRTLSNPSMPPKSHRPSTAPGLSTIQARQSSGLLQHTSRETTPALKQSGRSQPNDGSSRATSFTLSKSRRSPERKSKTLPTIHAHSTSDTNSSTIAQAPSSSSYKRTGDVSREANLSGHHSSPISEGVATTSNQARAASSASAISRTFSLFSQKSVSDLRSGSATQLPLSIEVPSPSTKINRSTSYSLSSGFPSGSQPDQTLSPASLAPLRNSPVSLRTASTSFSSSPSPIRRTDSPRSHISIASPALDAIPQRLAVDDMKRLLSKPASVLSGSDSEGGYRSLSGPANARRLGGGAHSSDDDVTGGYRSSPGRLSGAFLSKSNPKLRVTREQSHSDDDGPTFLNQSPVLPTSSSSMKRTPSFDKKRNLLKRRPSAEKKAASMGIFPASYTKSQSKSSSSKSRSVSMNPLNRNRDGGVSEDASGLTPAGALALAYKQRQEEEEKRTKIQEEKEKKPSPADLARPPTLASRDPDSGPSPSPIYPSPDPGLRTAADPGLDAPTTPCYSIFGSTSGKLVALGGPEDSWTELSLGAGFVQSLGAGLGIDPLERTTTTTTTISGGLPKARPAKAPSHSIGRSLSRKMSGRWRKGSFTAAEIEWERVEPPVNKAVDKDLEHIREHDRVQILPLQQETTEERGRPSLQERRGQHRKSVVTGGELRVSVEQHAMPADNTSAQIVSSRQATPKSDSSAMDSPRSRKSESGAGSGKLWKLMKRISTGGLRDKYVDDLPYEPPPPVPALPKDYLDLSGGPRSMDGHGHGAQPPNILTKFNQSRPSMAIPRSSSALPTGAPPSANSRPVTTTSTASSAAYRQSTTTRSSSPVSSDVASSKFFNRAHSQRSSTSSYGEEIPPVPNTVVGEHIIPPHELYKLAIGVSPSDDTSSKGKSSSRKGHSTPRSASSPEKWTTPPSGGMGVDPPTLPSLPVPPSQRRNKLTKATRVPSPTIPAFSTEAPINTFASRKPGSATPSVEPQTLRTASPPRRPSRSPRRPSPTTSTSTSRVTSPLPTPPPLSIPPSLPESTTQINYSFDAKRASTASHATARPRSYASTFGGNGSTTTAQFREKTVPVPVRTEQEKADMWDDLLERSARAGGTLHLNGGDGLASDLLRFSGVSTDLEIDFS